MIITGTKWMVSTFKVPSKNLLTYTEQTFGVDIEARARNDRKRVPLVVTTILTFLDSRMCTFGLFSVETYSVQIIQILKATRYGVISGWSMSHLLQPTTCATLSTMGKPYLRLCWRNMKFL